ncbi:N-acetylmuramoyl-L-alanine amidase [Silicimonas algicola]|uniref:N-acetylmuramoyl-L-alanine amidase n=1 Tax=Silicimonas algicola TaxID=1826607 RepID=A0A316G7A2_9RHOB|nr:N-acetylmuramoyl-L-alanine amidase [Silicimonas algicola]AZQ67147.1 N-acetylmuramoyl-L-alanine amidase [Silicimonas algicola]PWK56794.1 N-acetylmuramoyl-L-alanine amidase [Silicimonas algicola]
MGSFVRIIVAMAAIFGACLSSGSAAVADGVVAEVLAPGVTIADEAGKVAITIPLSISVPWRVTLADGPPRVIVEFGDVDLTEVPAAASVAIGEITTEHHAPGWSRMVAVLREPLDVDTAEMTTADDGSAILSVMLIPATAETFRTQADPANVPGPLVTNPEARPMIAIDPGHGGFDPGAEIEVFREADLTLQFARKLREQLMSTDRFDVVLTREDDVFVSLDDRLDIAREAGADVFLSFHADALDDASGEASGVTVYRLSPEAAGNADEEQAERHGAANMLGGVDLNGAGDDVSVALLELARQDTTPRTDALSAALVSAFRSAELAVNSHPERTGDLAVLKASEIPSILIELGFLSSKADRARLASEKWQHEAAVAVRNALLLWEDEDRLRRDALRR